MENKLEYLIQYPFYKRELSEDDLIDVYKEQREKIRDIWTYYDGPILGVKHPPMWLKCWYFGQPYYVGMIDPTRI